MTENYWRIAIIRENKGNFKNLFIHTEINEQRVCLVTTLKLVPINSVDPHNLKKGRLSVC